MNLFNLWRIVQFTPKKNLLIAPVLTVQGDLGRVPGATRRRDDQAVECPKNMANEKVFLWSKLNNSPQVKEIHHIAEEAELQYMYSNNLKG